MKQKSSKILYYVCDILCKMQEGTRVKLGKQHREQQQQQHVGHKIRNPRREPSQCQREAQDWLTGLETYFREKGINENDWERAAHPLILFNIFKKEQTGTYFVQGPVARFFL